MAGLVPAISIGKGNRLSCRDGRRKLAACGGRLDEERARRARPLACHDEVVGDFRKGLLVGEVIAPNVAV
jgi:hypothetical protein